MKTRKLIALLTALLMTFSLFAASASAAYDDGGFSVMSLLPLEAYNVDVTINRNLSMPYELVNEPRYTVYVRELLAEALAQYGVTEPPEYVGYSTSSSITDYQLIGWNDKLIINRGADTLYFVSSGDQFNPDSKRIKVVASVEDEIYGSYSIDLTQETPENFNPAMSTPVTYGEILNDTLVANKIIPGDKYTLKVRRGSTGSEKDVRLTDLFDYKGNTNLYFIFDDGQGNDNSFKRITIRYSYTDPYLKFINSLNYNVKTAEGQSVKRVRTAPMSNSDGYFVEIDSAAYFFENGAVPYINLGYGTIEGATVQVYSGKHSDESELTPDLDITELITGDNQIELTYIGAKEDEPDVEEWSIPVTYFVTLENGSTFSLPCEIKVYLYKNSAAVITSAGSSVRLFASMTNPPTTQEEWEEYYRTNYLGLYPYIKGDDITTLGAYAYGTYINYITGTHTRDEEARPYITAAYQGRFDVLPSGTDARDIVDELFSSDYYCLDFVNAKDVRTAYRNLGYDRETGEYKWEEWNLATFEFTIFDIYGKVYHPEIKYAYKIEAAEETPEPPEDIPSDSTSFYVNYLGKEPTVLGQTGSGKTPRYKIEGISKAYDSYYNNGYRTYLVDDPEGTLTDGTVVYPNFGPTNKNISVYLNGEQDKNGILQESGVSPITYENGKTWLYSASAEDKEHSQNYYVTFVAPHKGGSKLFVNAADSEYCKNDKGEITREVVLMNTSYNHSEEYEHKILIANIGDEPLTGISVTLTGAQGVKLDPYWSVTEGSKATLAPFDGIKSDAYATDENGNVITDENGSRVMLDGFLQNTAMIKLLPDIENYTYKILIGYDSDGNPVYDETEIPGFVSIAGTLTISADGSEPKNIKLTGIVGNPKIISDGVRDGVKYVPYSSLIQTNSMYGNDNIEYTLLPGSKLPDGLEFMPNGEIYGIPKEIGTFTIGVKIQYTGPIPEGANESDYSDTRVYTFSINDNTDENVDAVNNIDNQGYPLTDRVSKYITVYYKGISSNRIPVIDRVVIDSDLFRSEGSYNEEFVAFYIDGIKLTEGVDYYAAEGSTKITVLAETFEHIGISDSDTPHTLAAEFRTDEAKLMRSAQNVYIEYVKKTQSALQPGGSFSGGGSFTGGGSFSGGSSSGGSSSDTNAVAVEPSFNSVNINMSISDANGSAVPNLALELHSAVQYATSDASGAVKFDNVEFGRHTLYITDPVTNETSSKTFTLVSGFGTEITDDIIVAEVGKTISVAITFDGGNIVLASAQTDVDVPTESAATDEEPEEEAGTDAAPADTEPVEESNPKTGIVLGVVPVAALAGLIVSLKRK